jgi:predicted dehydrogenase
MEKAYAFADDYGVKPFVDVAEMVKLCGINAAAICTPHPAHAQPALAAMKNGAHVIVEKPLASTLTDCDLMLECAQSNNVKLAMISQRRLFEPCQRVHKAIFEGKIGHPVLGVVTLLGWRDREYYTSDPWRGTWENEGGGVLVNQAPHQLDLLHWFMGPVDELFGFWQNFNHPYIEVEDTAVAVLRFKSGAFGNILVSNSQNPALYGKVHVHGSNGASIGVQTDGGAMFIAGMSKIEEPPVNDIWTVPGEGDLLKRWQKEDTDQFQRIDAVQYYHHLQLEDFLRSILDDKPPMIPGDEGRKTVEIFTAIYRSQAEGRPVRFPL